MVLKAVLIIAVFIAGYCDIRWRRIPNYLVLTGLVVAVLWYAVMESPAGLLQAFQGFGIGIALLFIPFLLRGMGAGDVKLLGMVGALQGPVFVVNTFLWMAVWGGLMAMIYLAYIGKIQLLVLQLVGAYYPPWRIKLAVLKSKNSFSQKVTIPYGVAIGLGAISTMLWMWW